MNRVVKSRLRSRLIVTLKSGQAFDGVLVQADREAWALRNVTALEYGENREAVPVDGEVLLLTADIDFVNRP